MRHYLTLLLLAFSSPFLYSQDLILETLSSGGASFSNNQTLFAWTLGETSTESSGRSESGYLHQGFHQAFDRLIDFVCTPDGNFSFFIFPNPCFNELEIYTSQTDFLVVEIYDMKGSLVRKIRNIKSGQILDVASYSPGTYIVLIRDQMDLLGTSLLQKI